MFKRNAVIFRLRAYFKRNAVVYVAASKWSAVNISLFKRNFPAFIRILRVRAYFNHFQEVVIFRFKIGLSKNLRRSSEGLF